MNNSAFTENSRLLQNPLSYLTRPDYMRSLRVTETLRDDKIEETQNAMVHIVIMKMLCKLQFGIVAVLFPIYARQQYGNISATMIGLIMGIYQFGSGLASMQAGVHAINIGHKNAFFIGIGVFTAFQITFVLSFLAESLSLFYTFAIISRIFAGVGEGLLTNSSYSVPSSQLPHLRDNYIALIQIFDLIGVVLGMFYCSLFSLFTDFVIIMMITLIQVVIYLPIAYCYIPDRFNTIKKPEIMSVHICDDSEDIEISYKLYLKNATSLISIIFSILIILSHSSLQSCGSLALQDEGLSDSAISLISIAAIVFAIIVVVLTKSKIKQLHPQNIRAFNLINLAILFWIVYAVKGKGSIIWAVLMFQVFVPFVVITGILDKLAGTEKMLRQERKDLGKDPDIDFPVTLDDKAISLTQFTVDKGITFGPLIGGAIYEAVGRDIHQASLWIAVMTTTYLFVYVVIVYFVCKDSRIKNYDTLDGLMTTRKITQSDQKDQANDLDSESLDSK